MKTTDSESEVLKVLDLFSGLGGWGAAFRDRGHHVVSLDFDPKFGADFVTDVMGLKALNGWDVILASPPCDCFSPMTIGKYWTGGAKAYEPKNDKARAALALMQQTFALVAAARPSFYVIENPRGIMRKVAPRPPDVTTWFCQWGTPYAKPTDLWTNLIGPWPLCRNGNPDHEAAPRGSHDNGIQLTSRNPAGRGLIPYQLSKSVAIACETDGAIVVSGNAVRQTYIREVVA